jgi:hypothetical protein
MIVRSAANNRAYLINAGICRPPAVQNSTIRYYMMDSVPFCPPLLINLLTCEARGVGSRQSFVVFQNCGAFLEGNLPVFLVPTVAIRMLKNRGSLENAE